MTLPADGFPRISSEGIRLLVAGLAGDFTGWERHPTNHPLEIPREHVRNCAICADPVKMHFICTTWYGSQYPRLDGAGMAPRVEFDAVDLKEIYVPPTCTISLYRKGGWGFCTGVLLGIDDRGVGTRETTRFDVPTAIPVDAPDDEEDEADCTECRDRQRTLGEWA